MSPKDGELALKVGYLLCQKVKPLESTYPIQHLNSHDNTLIVAVKSNLAEGVGMQNIDLNRIIRQGINLVRLIQLWHVLERDQDLANSELKEIEALLRRWGMARWRKREGCC